MKPVTILGLSILGFGAWWAWKKYTLLENVQIEIGSVNFDGGLLNPNIKIDLKVVNPTKLEATVTSLNGVILDNKRNRLGTLSINGVYNISPGALQYIPINIQTDTVALLTSAVEYFTNKTETLNISGYATIDNVPVPYNFSITV